MFHLSFRENCFLNVYHSESGVRNPSPRYRKFAVFGLPLCFFYSLPLLRLCIFTHHFPFFRSAGDTSQFSLALHFACCSLLLKDHFSRWQLRPEPTQVSGFPALGHEVHNLGPRLVLSIRELVFIWAVRFAKICCSRSFYWNKYLSSLVGPFISQARETNHARRTWLLVPETWVFPAPRSSECPSHWRNFFLSLSMCLWFRAGSGVGHRKASWTEAT